MKIGDVVIPASPKYPFACGTGTYTHAICMWVDPFVLISDWGDMVWTHLEPERCIALCLADSSVRKMCEDRMKRDGDLQDYIKYWWVNGKWTKENPRPERAAK